MKNKNNLNYIFLLILFVFFFIPVINAQSIEDGDIMFQGLELEKILSFIIAILCTILFIITFLAYKRDGRKRLFFVSMAFLLFAIKSLLISSELFIAEIEFFNPLAIILEFGAVLSFFYGTIKK